jgi:hypothetical protein
MNEVPLPLPDQEAKALYRHLHRMPGGQDRFCEAYQQLQSHFFRSLTVEEITILLEGEA